MFNLFGRTVLPLIMWILVTFPLSAQTGAVSNTATTTLSLGVTEVSLLRLTDGLINLQLNQQKAGLSLEASKSDSTARLLISSVISNSPRVLTAKISAGTVPTGSHLELVATQPNQNFVGSTGTLSSSIILDGTDKPFVTEISTCYSGTGSTDGYPLKFTYALDVNASSYGNLRATMGTQIIVMFTLTAVQ